MSPETSIPQRKCRVCGNSYPETPEYFIPFQSTSGKSYFERSCRNCRRAQSQLWKLNNHEKHLQLVKDWQAKNPEKAKQYKKNYAKNHPEKVKQARANWDRQHPDHHKIRTRNRRAKLKTAGGKFTVEDIHHQLLSQKNLCWWCGEPLSDNYHIDHRVPVSRGGSNDPRNIVISCPTCNLSRADKLPQEWNGRLL